MKQSMIITLMLVSLLLVACSPGPEDKNLPTLLIISTDTAPLGTATARPTLPPTWTLVPSATGRPSETARPSDQPPPSATITDTPTHTPTWEATEIIDRPISDLIQLALQTTVLPQGSVPVPVNSGNPISVSPIANAVPTSAFVNQTCNNQAGGDFAAKYQADPTLKTYLGCPIGAAISVNAALQPFQQGKMIWIQSAPGSQIYVLLATGGLERYADTWMSSIDPENYGQVAPAGLVAPLRGFGKVWHQQSHLINTLGWATQAEAGMSANLQYFDNGLMLSLQGQIYILIIPTNATSGRWQN